MPNTKEPAKKVSTAQEECERAKNQKNKKRKKKGTAEFSYSDKNKKKKKFFRVLSRFIQSINQSINLKGTKFVLIAKS